MSADGRHAAQRYEDRYFIVRDGLRLHYRDYPGAAGQAATAVPSTA